MTPEKWKELMEESSWQEKPFLYVYREYVKRPLRTYVVVVAFCALGFVQSFNVEWSTTESIEIFGIMVGIGSVFLYYVGQFGTWLMLRANGIPADYLRDDDRTYKT